MAENDLRILHDSTIEILRDVGVKFNNSNALNICRENGINVDHERVFFSEKDIFTTLENVPSQFSVRARNDKNNINVGGEDFILVPACGATSIVDPEGKQRDGTMDDYNKLCMLVQTSEYLDCIGSFLILPSELAAETSHLDMLLSTVALCDKPLVVSTTSEYAAYDAINMGKIVFNEINHPVMIGMISSFPPLQFSGSSTQSLIEFARAGQAISINASSIMGLTAPVTMAGAQVVQNAAFLAGMCLAQIVNPGTPIIYGISGAPMDMKTGNPAYGSPELAKSLFIGSELARFYRVPCRGGGAFTDTCIPDIQAGMESAFVLSAAAMSGMNLSICSCGMLGSYLGMSFEKFLIDEDLCGMVKKLLQPISLAQNDICLDIIKKVGIGNNYVMETHTLERCRTEFFIPNLLNRVHQAKIARLEETATQDIFKRVSEFEQPELDKETRTELNSYVKKRKEIIMKS